MTTEMVEPKCLALKEHGELGWQRQKILHPCSWITRDNEVDVKNEIDHAYQVDKY